MPLSWKPHKRAQKDVDAKWTKKHGKNHFGYKLHASVDKRYKIIRKIAVTHAALGDTSVCEEILDPTNTSRDVYADRGYPSIERETKLKQAGWRVHIQRRGHSTKGISNAQKRRNRAIATPRARVEHVFGALAQMGGKVVRCLGIVRTTFALYVKAATYNLERLVFLKNTGWRHSELPVWRPAAAKLAVSRTAVAINTALTKQCRKRQRCIMRHIALVTPKTGLFEVPLSVLINQIGAHDQRYEN